MPTFSASQERPDSLKTVVLDTNIFVAAGFNPGSHAARILHVVRGGDVRMVWHETTRREIRYVLGRIPPLHGFSVEDLFRRETEYRQLIHPEQYRMVPDPDDRKFIALAHASGAVLISRDEHLLQQRAQTDVPILTASEYWRRYRSPGA